MQYSVLSLLAILAFIFSILIGAGFSYVYALSPPPPVFKSGENVFNINFSFFNGKIINIAVNEESTGLVMFLSTSGTEDGILEITLPRETIDAKKDGNDIDFIVLVDGRNTDFQQTNKTSTERTLRIPVPAGSEEIVIRGTQVVPEFGLLVMLILATSVGIIIAVGRKNQLPPP